MPALSKATQLELVTDVISLLLKDSDEMCGVNAYWMIFQTN